jgi:hypothetical protein
VCFSNRICRVIQNRETYSYLNLHEFVFLTHCPAAEQGVTGLWYWPVNSKIVTIDLQWTQHYIDTLAGIVDFLKTPTDNLGEWKTSGALTVEYLLRDGRSGSQQ